MSIISKIKKTVESVIGNGRFYYNDGEGLNIELDNATYPCAFAQLVDAGALTDSLGQFHERIGIGVFFANTADIELEPLKNEDILTDLKKSALTWLATVSQSSELRLTEVRSTDRVYIKSDGEYDVRLTAFVVYVTIEEIEGFGACQINECNCDGC